MQKKSFRLYLIITGVLIIGVVILLFVFQKSLNFKKPAKFVYPVETITSSIMEQEEEACFRFLWENTNTNPDSHGYGLVLDRSVFCCICRLCSCRLCHWRIPWIYFRARGKGTCRTDFTYPIRKCGTRRGIFLSFFRYADCKTLWNL